VWWEIPSSLLDHLTFEVSAAMCDIHCTNTPDVVLLGVNVREQNVFALF
jgi:hypothetical protein